MPTFPGGQITSVSPTFSVGGEGGEENKIFSGTTRNSHFSGEKILAGNQSLDPGRGRGRGREKTTFRAGGKTTTI